MFKITNIAEMRSIVATVPHNLDSECTNFIYAFINIQSFTDLIQQTPDNISGV
jgi:hypothetical protein